jgi:hypothetical protein
MIVFHWIRPQLCWNLKPHVWYVMLKHQVLPCRQSNFMFQMSFCYSVWTWSCWSCWPVDMIQFQVQRSRYFGGNFLLEPCWGRHTGIPWEVLHAFLVLAFGVFVDVLWIGVRQGWDCLCSPKEKLVSVHLAGHSSYVRRCLKQAAKISRIGQHVIRQMYTNVFGVVRSDWENDSPTVSIFCRWSCFRSCGRVAQERYGQVLWYCLVFTLRNYTSSGFIQGL